MNLCLNCHKACTRKFCSRSCSNIYNSTRKAKKLKQTFFCKNCNKKIFNHHFCNNKCEQEHFKKIRYELIESGKCKSNEHLRSYLIEKFGNKCMICGWNKINESSGMVPIELHHEDANHKNMTLENVKLLCPNCHSLTKTFKRHGKKKKDCRCSLVDKAIAS